MSTQEGYGVVQKAHSLERTCQVKWLGNSDSVRDDCVSVYDIGYHSDFNFRSGDVVIRLTASDDAGRSPEQASAESFPPCGQVR